MEKMSKTNLTKNLDSLLASRKNKIDENKEDPISFFLSKQEEKKQQQLKELSSIDLTKPKLPGGAIAGMGGVYRDKNKYLVRTFMPYNQLNK
jgi:hypothetical protein